MHWGLLGQSRRQWPLHLWYERLWTRDPGIRAGRLLSDPRQAANPDLLRTLLLVPTCVSASLPHLFRTTRAHARVFASGPRLSEVTRAWANLEVCHGLSRRAGPRPLRSRLCKSRFIPVGFPARPRIASALPPGQQHRDVLPLPSCKHWGRARPAPVAGTCSQHPRHTSFPHCRGVTFRGLLQSHTAVSRALNSRSGFCPTLKSGPATLCLEASGDGPSSSPRQSLFTIPPTPIPRLSDLPPGRTLVIGFRAILNPE